jgi:hypothetical protein
MAGSHVEGSWIDVETGKLIAAIPVTPIVDDADTAAQVITAAIARAEAAPLVAEEPADQDRPIVERWWFWALAGAAAVIAASTATALVVGANDDDKRPPPNGIILGF